MSDSDPYEGCTNGVIDTGSKIEISFSDLTHLRNLGDTTWVLVSTILVLGMMPALAFFEAGLLRRY
jgi:hypothetical protein